MIKHIQKWNEWRKHNGNNPIHKFMVLIGLIKSPTFALFVTQKEADNNYKAFMDAINSLGGDINE